MQSSDVAQVLTLRLTRISHLEKFSHARQKSMDAPLCPKAAHTFNFSVGD